MYQALKHRNAILIAILPSIAIALFNGFYKESSFLKAPAIFWTLDIIQFVIIPVICIWGLSKFANLYPRDYGFQTEIYFYDFFKLILLTIFLSITYWFFYEPVTSFTSYLLNPKIPSFTYAMAIPKPFIIKLITVFYYSITAGVVEEIMLKSLPWIYFCSCFSNKKFRTLLFVLSTSVLFGIIHWENGVHEIISTFILWVVGTYLYTKIENIIPFILAHAITDFYIFIG